MADMQGRPLPKPPASCGPVLRPGRRVAGTIRRHGPAPGEASGRTIASARAVHGKGAARRRDFLSPRRRRHSAGARRGRAGPLARPGQPARQDRSLCLAPSGPLAGRRRRGPASSSVLVATAQAHAAKAHAPDAHALHAHPAGLGAVGAAAQQELFERAGLDIQADGVIGLAVTLR